MDTTMLIEILGYIGSVLVVVSMLMSSIVKLRIINTVGSIISAVYAIVCGALPLALMNICLIIINVYNLIKLLKTKQVYDLVVGDGEDELVKYFLARHEKDIQTYFPGFAKEDVSAKKAYIVCCDDNLAGILLAEENAGAINITIDYSTPAYRDCSVGTYLYSKLSAEKIDRLIYAQSLSETHVSYMKKMAFVQENGVYVKKFN